MYNEKLNTLQRIKLNLTYKSHSSSNKDYFSTFPLLHAWYNLLTEAGGANNIPLKDFPYLFNWNFLTSIKLTESSIIDCTEE